MHGERQEIAMTFPINVGLPQVIEFIVALIGLVLLISAIRSLLPHRSYPSEDEKEEYRRSGRWPRRRRYQRRRGHLPLRLYSSFSSSLGYDLCGSRLLMADMSNTRPMRATINSMTCGNPTLMGKVIAISCLSPCIPKKMSIYQPFLVTRITQQVSFAQEKNRQRRCQTATRGPLDSAGNRG